MHRMSDANRAAQVSNPGASLRRLISYFKPYTWKMIVITVLIIIFAGLNIVGPYLMSIAIDDFIEVKDANGLITIILAMVITYLGMWLSEAIYRRMMAAVAQKMLRTLRQELFEHMQKLSMSFYDTQSAGDLMSRLTNDMDNINMLLTVQAVNFISSIVTLVGVITVMFILNVWLTLATLIVFPIMLFIMGQLMSRIGPAFREQQITLGKLNGLMEETISGQRVVIAYGQQDSILEEFDASNDVARSASIRAQILAGLMIPIMMGLGNLDLAVVIGVGGFLVVRGIGGMTVGLITAYTSYARSINHPIMQLSNLFNAIIAALAGAERIFEIIDTEPQVQDKTDAVEFDTLAGAVRFDDVDFSYTADTPILMDVNLDAHPGQMIALVGPTGAGKTTIVNVLSRFYDIDDGTICFDNHEIRDLSQDCLRKNLGIVLQDTYLFSASVMDNIRYGRLEATDEEVYAAARLANADGFIRHLPEGYNTMLSERASNLSQGQRQLLAIARAILADPSILVLDEATSSVDTRTEKQIQEGFRNLMTGRTSFVIAHRLSTIREADQILVVNDGRIIETGTHNSLLDAKGFYYDLYTSQFKGTAVAV